MSEQVRDWSKFRKQQLKTASSASHHTLVSRAAHTYLSGPSECCGSSLLANLGYLASTLTTPVPLARFPRCRGKASCPQRETSYCLSLLSTCPPPRGHGHPSHANLWTGAYSAHASFPLPRLLVPTAVMRLASRQRCTGPGGVSEKYPY